MKRKAFEREDSSLSLPSLVPFSHELQVRSKVCDCPPHVCLDELPYGRKCRMARDMHVGDSTSKRSTANVNRNEPKP